MKKIILLITITLFLRLVRGTTDQFINGFGLFYDVWSPIAEASIFVVASVLFGSIWGLNGILLGPIISMGLIIHMWKPYFLFRKGLKRSLWLYIQLVAFFVLSIAISYIVSTVIISLMCLEPVTWMSLLLCSILFVACYSTILFGLFYSLSLNFRHITKEIVQQMKRDHDESQHGISWRTISLEIVPQEKWYTFSTIIDWKYRVRDSY